MHDSRKSRQFDSLNQFGPRGRGRGRGRGARGFRGGFQRDLPGRNGVQEESSWGHDGFEELEPQQSSRPGSSRVSLYRKRSDHRQKRKVSRAQLDDKLPCRMPMIPLTLHHSQPNNRKRPSKLQRHSKILAMQRRLDRMFLPSPVNLSLSISPSQIRKRLSKMSLSTAMSVEFLIKSLFEVTGLSKLHPSTVPAIVRFTLQRREVGYLTS